MFFAHKLLVFFLEAAFHCAFHLYVSIKIVLHAGMTALREHFEQSFYRFRAVNLCIEGRVLLENEMVESGALAHMVSAEQAVAALQLFLVGLQAVQSFNQLIQRV